MELENSAATDNTATKPKGTIIKVIKGVRREKSTGYQIDYSAVWYRDEQHKKQCIFYDRPTVPYYVIKDKTSSEATKPPMFIEESKVDKFECYADVLNREVAKHIPEGLTFYNDMVNRDGMRAASVRDIQANPYIYGSDIVLYDRMFAKFINDFDPLDDYNLRVCYYDIEVDLAEHGLTPDRKGNVGYMSFPDETVAPCPINLITIVDDRGTGIDIYTFIHKNQLNTQIDEFKNNIQTICKGIQDRIIEECEKVGQHVVVDNFFQLFYDDELDMITAFCDKVHEIDPDIMSAWNARFDFLTIQNRLIQLLEKRGNFSFGWNAEKAAKWILCDKKYMNPMGYLNEPIEIEPTCMYRSDTKMGIQDRIDECIIFDGINWFDQLLYYAALRKQFGALDSYKLDDVTTDELNVNKLKFPKPLTIKTAAWKDFALFAEYNIRDCILLMLLGRKGEDYQLLQSLAEITQSCHAKVMRKTQSLKNFIAKYATNKGYIMSNNKNMRKDEGLLDKVTGINTSLREDDERYQELLTTRQNFGAVVADMSLLTDNGIKLFNKRSSKIFDNVTDMDLRSLYPSTILAFNMSADTLVGKLFLDDPKIRHILQDKYNAQLYLCSSAALEPFDDKPLDLSILLVDTLITQDWCRLGEEFFGLPGTTDIMNKIESKLINRSNGVV